MKAIFAVRDRNTLPILDCALYTNGWFHATDLESHVAFPLEVPGLPDNTLFNRKWLSALYGQSKTLTYADGKLNGVAIPSTGMGAEDFPINVTITAFYPKATIAISAFALKGLTLASGKQDRRYYLNGALADFGGARMVATDGHRLHMQIDLAADGNGETIVPNGAIDLIIKAAAKGEWIKIEHDPDVKGGEWVRLTTGDTIIHCQPIDGKFPDIDKVIPDMKKQKASIQIETKQGTADIKHYLQLARSTGNKSGGCAFKNKELNGTDSISIPVESVVVNGIDGVGCNTAYIIDALAFLDENQSTFYTVNADSALIANSMNRTAVVMPMRL